MKHGLENMDIKVTLYQRTSQTARTHSFSNTGTCNSNNIMAAFKNSIESEGDS